MTAFINSENTWVLWALLVVIAAVGITLEQKTKWAAHISAGGLCMLFGILLTTIQITPSLSEVYTTVNNYILPLSIPLLLFRCDLRKILKESGRLFIIFHVACFGCMIATVLVGFCFRGQENIRGIVAMMTGACTGGPVNLIAMSKVFNVEDSMISAAIVGIIIVITLELVILSVFSKTKYVHKHFAHPHMDKLEENLDADEKAGTIASRYWDPKKISLLSLGQSMAISFAICTISTLIANAVSSSNLSPIIKQFFGTNLLLVTLFTVLLVTIFPKFFSNLGGAEELGTFAMTLYFASVGMGSNLLNLLTVAPVILLMIVAIILCVFGILFLATRIFKKWDWESFCNAACASIGGPTTACAISISNGWKDLIIPGILVGLWGYVIGNYLGILCAQLF